MAGAVIQLSTQGVPGANDLWISPTAEASFWKSHPFKHTPFVIDSVEQDAQADGFGKVVTFDIQRRGDLIKDMWLEITLGALDKSILGSTPFNPTTDYLGWANHLGHTLIRQVELTLQGSLVDRIYGESMHIQSKLSTPPGREEAQKVMVGEWLTDTDYRTNGLTERTLYVRLPFWFTHDTGLAYPHIGANQTEMRLALTIRQLYECIRTNVTGITTLTGAPTIKTRLWVDYVLLAEDERRKLANPYDPAQADAKLDPPELTYYITQTQALGDQVIDTSSPRATIKMEQLSLSVKELFLIFQLGSKNNNGQASPNLNAWFDYSPPDGVEDIPATILFRMGGSERTRIRDAKFYRLVHPSTIHSHVPTNRKDRIYAYSLALDPEDYNQPSGHVNASRLVDFTMEVTFNTTALPAGDKILVRVYALNWNVLAVKASQAMVRFAS